MPLKHATETILVFFLAVAILATGIVLKFLPALPAGLLPWSIAFLVSMAYPLSLYSLMRKRRADYSLRALHFIPALLLLAWLALQFLSMKLVIAAGILALLAWGLGAIPVAIGIVLLGLYCLHVIRQRSVRLPVLSFLLVPFLLLGTTVEYVSNTPASVAGTQSSASSAPQIANLDPSDDPAESRWRGVLRRMQRREERLQRNNEDPLNNPSIMATASSSQGLIIGAAVSSRASARSMSSGQSSSAGRTVVEAPPVLTSSGLSPSMLALLTIAGYCAALQGRAMKRRENA